MTGRTARSDYSVRATGMRTKSGTMYGSSLLSSSATGRPFWSWTTQGFRRRAFARPGSSASTRTAGRVENSQVGTFLAYVTDAGHTLIDRELYLPASWTDDRERCRAAAAPDGVAFATKIDRTKATPPRPSRKAHPHRPSP
jgi:hypothetical protein